eukprot:2090105-Amphidinium_carterae.1
MRPNRLQVLGICCTHLLSCAAAAFTPTAKRWLAAAVRDWLEDDSMAEAEYGHISLWNTSM